MKRHFLATAIIFFAILKPYNIFAKQSLGYEREYQEAVMLMNISKRASAVMFRVVIEKAIEAKLGHSAFSYSQTLNQKQDKIIELYDLSHLKPLIDYVRQTGNAASHSDKKTDNIFYSPSFDECLELVKQSVDITLKGIENTKVSVNDLEPINNKLRTGKCQSNIKQPRFKKY